MVGEFESLVQDAPLILLGGTASLFAGLFTGIGALPVLAVEAVSRRQHDILLGFAAGVMLAAAAFSLIIPGIETGTSTYGSAIAAVATVSVGLLVGAVGLALLHRYAPHEHFLKGREGGELLELRRLWLFVIAITLHNFPEGLAVGVGFGGGDFGNGLALSIGMALQNAPEGLAVAAALLAVGYSRREAIGVAFLTGLVEPIGGVIGAGAVSVSALFLPFGLAFAGGAMLFVITHEIIPESHRSNSDFAATGALMIGFTVMMVLDVLLG